MDAMAKEAKSAGHEECCGLLMGDSMRITVMIPAANVATNRRQRFEIDPVVLLAAHKAARSGGLQISGYYHSHPTGLPCPSGIDRRHAAGDSRIWAIIAAGEIRFWRDLPDGFKPLGYRVVDA